MKRPEPLQVSREELVALRERAKAGTLREEDAALVESLAETVVVLSDAVQTKSTGIRRLLRVLFGTKTEKKSKLFGKSDDPDADPPAGGSSGGGTAAGNAEPKQNPKPKGHGRNPADAYTRAERVRVPHPDLHPGDRCPACQRGRLYSKEPSQLVTVQAQPPCTATIHECERLRCSGCGATFTAPAPPGVAQGKYDRNVGVMIALLKYGAGMPFLRLARLQEAAGVPLPPSVQWERVVEAAEPCWTVFEELWRQGARGEVVHNDDTTMKILEFLQPGESTETADPSPKKPRRGVYTTGIISQLGPRRIALFRTGREHAGENLAALLAQRPDQAPPPIQMCDGLGRNKPGTFEVLLANCLAHARRQFLTEIENFPDECRHVIDLLAEVYQHDDTAHQENLDADQRLRYHQRHSAPPMEQLKQWCRTQLDEHLVEPNSGLGQALRYLQKHWDRLTLFLRQPGAPLDNNICERALKKAILHRKNAYFFKTERGARVGDLFMSLIHTCELNGVNALDYLQALVKHARHSARDPVRWLPWTYRDTLAAISPA